MVRGLQCGKLKLIWILIFYTEMADHFSECKDPDCPECEIIFFEAFCNFYAVILAAFLFYSVNIFYFV